MRARILALALLVLGMGRPSPGRADEARRITVIRPAAQSAMMDEATTRLAAELRAAGFEPDLVAPGGPPSSAPSLGTMTVVPAGDGAFVEVAVGGKLRRVGLREGGGNTDASDLAIHSVEVLRASLIEARAGTQTPLRDPSSPVVATPPPARPAPPPGQPALSFSLALGLDLLINGDLPTAPGFFLRGSLDHRSGFSVRAAVTPGLIAAHIEATAGTLSLRQTLATVDVAYRFLGERARLSPFLALGAGAYELHVEGEARPPYQGERHDNVSLALTLGAGAGLRLTPRFTLVGEVTALAVTPRLAVAVLDREVGRTGIVSFSPSLGLMASF